MKTLSSTLLAAQKSGAAGRTSKPVLRDYYAETPRLRFERWYTGAEADGPIALRRSRRRSPRAGAQRWRHAVRLPRRLARQRLDVLELEQRRDSVQRRGRRPPASCPTTTSGSCTSPRTTRPSGSRSRPTMARPGARGTGVITAGGNKDHLAAAANPAGDVVLFWNEGATVYTSRWNGSTWGARTAWSASAASVTGLAVRNVGDFQVVAYRHRGHNGRSRRSGRCASATATRPPPAHGVRCARSPRPRPTPTSASRIRPWSSLGSTWRLFFLETFAGDAAYVRVQYATSPIQLRFQRRSVARGGRIRLRGQRFRHRGVRHDHAAT